MGNDLQVFNNPEFGKVRAVLIDGEPWFVAADVGRILKLSNVRMSLQRLDDDEKGVSDIDTQGGYQQMAVVNEFGFYRLISTSNVAFAKAVQRWLFHEVVPSIRKTGMYINPNAPIDPNFLRRIADELEGKDRQITALTAENETQRAEITRLDSENTALEHQKAVLQPKADYHDAVLTSEDAIPITVIAKDYGMSGVALNKLLHHNGVQFPCNGTWVLYRKYDRRGYTVSQTILIDDKGNSRVVTYWTQKGREFLYHFLKAIGVVPVRERAKYLPALF